MSEKQKKRQDVEIGVGYGDYRSAVELAMRLGINIREITGNKGTIGVLELRTRRVVGGEESVKELHDDIRALSAIVFAAIHKATADPEAKSTSIEEALVALEEIVGGITDLLDQKALKEIIDRA